jgi:hypothetical protein
MSMKKLWLLMMGRNHFSNPEPDIRAFATLTGAVTLYHWNGGGKNPEFREEVLPPGTRINVVMASRFGDVGITNNMGAVQGYEARIQCVDALDEYGAISIPAQEGLLIDIETREENYEDVIGEK